MVTFKSDALSLSIEFENGQFVVEVLENSLNDLLYDRTKDFQS